MLLTHLHCAQYATIGSVWEGAGRVASGDPSASWACPNSRRSQRFTCACSELAEGLTIPRHPGRLNRLVLTVTVSAYVSAAILTDVAALPPGLRTPLPALSVVEGLPATHA